MTKGRLVLLFEARIFELGDVTGILKRYLSFYLKAKWAYFTKPLSLVMVNPKPFDFH